MTIYMVHPKHGRMPVYSLEEIERAQMHGWTRADAAPDVAAPVAAPVAAEPAPKRRGRPPKVRE